MAGIPNITGNFGGVVCIGCEYGGAFGKYGDDRGIYGEKNATPGFTSHYDFYASRSSSIYGSSNTVTPISLSTKFIISYV